MINVNVSREEKVTGYALEDKNVPKPWGWLNTINSDG